MSVPSAPVEVRGEGVLLRAPRESDVDRLLEAFGDSGTQLWNPGPQDREGVLAWMAERADWSAGTHTSWLIAQPHDDDVLGSVSVWKIDLEQGDGEVGYWVAPWGRGRGVASSAVRAAAAYAFDELGLDRLHTCSTRSRTLPRAGSRARPGSCWRGRCASPTSTPTAGGTTSTCTPASAPTEPHEAD